MSAPDAFGPEGSATGFVRLDAVRKTYGEAVALEEVTLAVNEGELLTLLGPSGSGKTTCLRVIAGMIRPDSGTLSIAGRDVSAVPMHRRNIGMVFQNYSLFPHLTVAQNVAYPLRVRRVSGKEAQTRVADALELVQLGGYGRRRPSELSGGQQQRVALARALVFRPDVLLLDEPLSALDRVLREEMQLELRRIHRETGMTMVCVTHDRSEALTLSDRILVMRAGRIVQDGAPQELYRNSGSRFVAEFLGEVNVLPMTMDEHGRTARDARARELVLPSPSHPPGANVDVIVRVENVRLAERRAAAGRDGPDWSGTIREALFLGDAVRFVIDCEPHVLTARVPLDRARGLATGSPVDLALMGEAPLVYPRQTGRTAD